MLNYIHYCRLVMLFALLSFTTISAPYAAAQELPEIPGLGGTEGADTMTAEGLISGSIMNEEQCRYPGSSHYMVVDGRGECIRYYSAGLDPDGENEKVIVIFHGDVLAAVHDSEKYTKIIRQQVPNSYIGTTTDKLQSIVDNVYEKTKIPAIFYARPGTYGASGDHKARRQPREGLIIAHGMEWLKQRYKVGQFHITGQSGGGHVVATLLTFREDIGCAVMTSGVVAVGLRIKIRGWPADSTGFSTYYDPYTEAELLPPLPGQRIFVVGDKRDSNVPFPSQAAYYQRLKNAGHDIMLIEAPGSGRSRHGLFNTGITLVGHCAAGMGTNAILAGMKRWRR